MEAFDKNVVVRLCVRDDEEQCRRAEGIFRQATAGAGAWLSSVVLVDVTWVLSVAYKFDRPTVAATLRKLIAIDGVHLEDEATTRLALAALEIGSADFSDHLRRCWTQNSFRDSEGEKRVGASGGFGGQRRSHGPSRSHG